MSRVSFRKADTGEFNVFYREAGPEDASALLLLHGFPSASHMFRDLIPRLSDRFRVIAPDLAGFGQSDMPERPSSATPSTTLRKLLAVSQKRSDLPASPSTSSTMALQLASGSQRGIPNASLPSSRRTAMLMLRV